MENITPDGVGGNTSHEGIMEIVNQLQTLEAELATLKTHQEELRQMPDRAEKNSLLGEIEDKIRGVIDSINNLQNKKMELIRAGDEKYMIKEEAANSTLPMGSTLEEDPFRMDPQSQGSWRQLNK